MDQLVDKMPWLVHVLSITHSLHREKTLFSITDWDVTSPTECRPTNAIAVELWVKNSEYEVHFPGNFLKICSQKKPMLLGERENREQRNKEERDSEARQSNVHKLRWTIKATLCNVAKLLEPFWRKLFMKLIFDWLSGCQTLTASHHRPPPPQVLSHPVGNTAVYRYIQI